MSINVEYKEREKIKIKHIDRTNLEILHGISKRTVNKADVVSVPPF